MKVTTFPVILECRGYISITVLELEVEGWAGVGAMDDVLVSERKLIFAASDASASVIAC